MNEELADAYISLIEKCITGAILENRYSIVPEKLLNRDIAKWLRDEDLKLVYKSKKSVVDEGREWPFNAVTMIGNKRIANLRFCVEDTIRNGIPGDFIETGVWRGGAIILMAAILKAYGTADRTIWAADSFKGLPKPAAEKYPEDEGSNFWNDLELAVPLPTVKRNIDRHGLLSERIKFLVGWFKDTLPGAPIEKLAVMRLDGDMYESTMDALVALYPKLSPGGYAIIDDYNDISSCCAAVTDYRKEHGIDEPIIEIDKSGVYWQKKA